MTGRGNDQAFIIYRCWRTLHVEISALSLWKRNRKPKIDPRDHSSIRLDFGCFTLSHVICLYSTTKRLWVSCEYFSCVFVDEKPSDRLFVDVLANQSPLRDIHPTAFPKCPRLTAWPLSTPLQPPWVTPSLSVSFSGTRIKSVIII